MSEVKILSFRKTVFALGLGFVFGYVAKQQMEQYQKVTPEKALETAKETFRKIGPISGSWIYMKPEQVEKNELIYNAYRGGITRNIDGENVQYDFFADIDTGAVIDTARSSDDL